MTTTTNRPIEIVLDGASHPLRRGVDVIRRIERATGLGIAALAMALAEQRLRLAHVAIIFAEGLAADDGEAPDVGAVGNAMIRDGLLHMYGLAFDYVMALVYGDGDTA